MLVVNKRVWPMAMPWQWVWQGLAAGLTGGTLLSGAALAQAEPPGIYYSWRAMAINVDQCIDQAENALASQDLNPVQTDAMSIAGQSEEATAVFVCMENPATPTEAATTTVMVIVASADNDQAGALRGSLKLAF